MYDNGMIAPVVVLAAWSLVMLFWLYATRIPAMRAAKIKPGSATKAQMETMPAWATNPANNYNHLMEQPTIFYAICFALELLDQANDINIGLAWLYVAIRVVHSLVQATINIIIIRFLIFSVGSIVLIALTFHALIAIGFVNINLPH
ncbi:MAG TPA: hypothetical protein DHW63_01175 [Hyphomonadaceae bacterium]|nr:hypothetical protein [Hyphomonadaceae bacterium]